MTEAKRPAGTGDSGSVGARDRGALEQRVRWRWWRYLTPAFVVWLLVFQAARLFTTPLAYDDAYLGAAAKSLAFGHGYATHYPSASPFDHRLGVGLALQLPAAALVSLFGNRYWVPGLATVLAIAILSGLIGLQLLRGLGTAGHRVAVVGLLGSAVITADRGEWILSHWYAYLGDIPAALAVMLGVLMMSRDLASSRVPSAATGLVFGLAAQIKLNAALGATPAVLVGLAVALGARNRDAARRSLLFGLMLTLPTLVAQAWQLIALGGPGPYVTHFRAWRAFLDSLSTLPPSVAFFRRAVPNLETAGEYFGGTGPVVCVGVLTFLMGLSLWGPARGTGRVVQRLATTLLLAAFVVHAAWWAVLSSTGWTNHLLPAFFYLAGAFALAVSLPRSRTLMVALCATGLLVAVPRFTYLRGYVPSVTPDPGLQAMLDTRDALMRQRGQGWTHIACGWWVPRDLEYLLPDVGNFEDCLQVDHSRFASGRLLLVRHVNFWNWEHDERLTRFAASCETTPVFRNSHYVVSRCTSPP